MLEDVWVVVPAYREAGRIGPVLDHVPHVAGGEELHDLAQPEEVEVVEQPVMLSIGMWPEALALHLPVLHRRH